MRVRRANKQVGGKSISCLCTRAFLLVIFAAVIVVVINGGEQPWSHPGAAILNTRTHTHACSNYCNMQHAAVNARIS